MKCADNCPYYWENEDDGFPCCHFNGYWEAPCEAEDYSDEY